VHELEHEVGAPPYERANSVVDPQQIAIKNTWTEANRGQLETFLRLSPVHGLDPECEWRVKSTGRQL
jgi:hypothetical protein